MAYSNINKPDEYFNTKLYTGNGSTQSITGVNFQPDLIWVKRRDTTGGNKITDSIRGAGTVLVTNSTDGEFSQTGIASFDSDGFTVGTGSVDFNASGGTYASWNWLAGGTASSNTDGSITSSVSANTTSGFSIVSVNTTGASGTITCGHGLGTAPSLIIWKNRSISAEWQVYHKSLGTDLMQLNTTGAVIGGGYWGSNPTSTVFSVTTNLYSANYNYIAYCFAEKKGFSKFGKYSGNSSTDGAFVYTGFKPAFVIIKASSIAGENWYLVDATRSTYNPAILYLSPNNSGAEASPGAAQFFDFLSNGFKLRVSGSYSNSSGVTYIYMAFAENPFVAGNYVPTTAR